MNTTLIYLGIITAAATFLGGVFAFTFKDRFHGILGFSAGAVIGLAFFDLMPESIELISESYSTRFAAMIIALGFVLYMLLDRVFSKHAHGTDSHVQSEQKGRGIIHASSLILHSMLDGLGIGFGFQISPEIGTLIAIGVLGHDFSDGINTVQAVLRPGFSKGKIFLWLTAGSIAPFLGILAASYITVSSSVLGIILGLFCGFFLYIGASDLIPESYHNHPKRLTTFMTILGIVFMFAIISLF